MAERKRSLWQKWRASKEEDAKDTEAKVFNPLDLRVSDYITVKHIDLEGLDFEVLCVTEIQRLIAGQSYPMVDYSLVNRGTGSEETFVTLRVIPLENPDREAGIEHISLALRPQVEFGFEQDVQDVLDANMGYVLYPGADDEAVFPTRVNDVPCPFTCEAKEVSDQDGDGEVFDHEIETYQFTYWDYWRELEDGQVEYLFVQIDNKDGWTQVYAGPQLSNEPIEKV